MDALAFLPAELLIRVLGLLNAYSLATCRAVSHRLKNIIDSAVILRYIIALERYGYQDGSSVPYLPNILDRLQALESHVDAWRKLSWTVSELDTSVPEELDENNEEDVEVWPTDVYFSHGILLYTHGSLASVVELPSIVRNVPAQRTWRFKLDLLNHTEDESVWCFMDPSSRLLIVVQDTDELDGCVMHLRDLFNGKPHPFAHSSTMSLGRMVNIASVFMQDNIIGFIGSMELEHGDSYYAPAHRLVLISWRLGKTLVDISIPLWQHGMCTFLDMFHILVAGHHEYPNQLRVYYIEQTPLHGPFMRHVASYQLPVNPTTLVLRVDAMNTQLSQNRAMTFTPSPFYHRPTDDLVHIRFFLSPSMETVNTFSDLWVAMAIPLKIFFPQWRMNSHRNSTAPIPWTEWGAHVIPLQRDERRRTVDLHSNGRLIKVFANPHDRLVVNPGRKKIEIQVDDVSRLPSRPGIPMWLSMTDLLRPNPIVFQPSAHRVERIYFEAVWKDFEVYSDDEHIVVVDKTSDAPRALVLTM